MHVFHSNLKSVEAPGFRDLHLRAELLGQVFQYDPITCCEEGEHIFDKVPFLFVQLFPVPHILVQVDLVGCPEGG